MVVVIQRERKDERLMIMLHQSPCHGTMLLTLQGLPIILSLRVALSLALDLPRFPKTGSRFTFDRNRKRVKETEKKQRREREDERKEFCLRWQPNNGLRGTL